MTDHTGHVLLIGRDGIEREGLRRLLLEADFTVRCIVPEHARLNARRRDRDNRHLVVLDGSIQDAPAQCREFVATHPDAKVALFMDGETPQQVIEAVAAGAIGVIDKGASCSTLVNSLKLITAGERVIPSLFIDQTLGRGLQDPAASQRIESSSLTDREKAVARCLANGLPNKLIARHLNLAEPTIKVHVKAILRKLGFSNRTQVAIWAVANEGAPAFPHREAS